MKMWIRQVVTLALFLALGIGAGLAVQQWRTTGDAATIGTVDRTTPGLPAGEHIVLVSLSTCPSCAAARNWLHAQGQDYLELAVDQSDEARALADRLGAHSVPMLIVGDRSVTGFDAETYARVLSERSPAS